MRVMRHPRDRRDPAGSDRAGDPLRHLQAQHEIAGLRRGRRMAPGLGVLSAHQRRSLRGRRHDGRLRDRERAAAVASRAATRVRSTTITATATSAGAMDPGAMRHRLSRGRAVPRQGGQHLDSSRARGARLGGQHVGEAAPSAALPVLRRRRLAARRHASAQGLGRVAGADRLRSVRTPLCRGRRRCRCGCRPPRSSRAPSTTRRALGHSYFAAPGPASRTAAR